MKIKRTPRIRVMLFLLAASSSLAMAQTATTGLVSGTVTDPSGASVPSAAVELSDAEIGAVLRTVANAAGQYVFPSVPSGTYQLKVTAPGFRTYVVGGLKVEVTKSNTQNVPLEVGATTETVSVTAGVTAEMQMVDATIGNVIALQQLKAFPTFTRTVNELLTLQPGATPSGEVTGARNDQSTFLLDGMDVTNNSTGGLGTFMYLGVESVEEFRVEVANPNASFGRGAGGQVALVGRHGTNAFHGSGFWYHQNDNLNANNWTNNRAKVRKPELKDNRYGFVAGGPIIPNKTFFFVNHDGRRFPRSGTVTRIVPTATMRQGILQFRDAAGNVNQYPLATSQACGPNGTDACDPRGLGLSPSIAALWQQLPQGNDPASGDGLNTLGFTSTVGFPNRYDFYHARLDHHLTQKWRLDASIRYYRQVDASNLALDIRGGNVASTRSSPTRQNMETVGISGTITPSLTADFRFGRVRQRTALDVLRPNASAGILNIPGTSTPNGPIALDIGARGGAQSILSEPFDVDTQLSRKQQNDNRTYQLNADLNWIKSKHSLQFGAHMRWLPTLHRRDDKVLGALGSLVAQIDSDLGTLVLPNSVAPPSCGAGRTAGCLQTADLQTWNRMFAGVTGLVDNISVLAVRDGSFKPLPFGDLLESDTTGIKAPEFYLQDTWRIKPTLTITLGLNYGWQTPPVERKGRYTLQLDKASGQILTPVPFFDGRRQGMLSGQINNPNFAFLPVNDAQRGVFNIDWMNLGPRASVAWNPDFKGGPLGKLLGGKSTVIRGGYALIYDRLNTVSSVIVPSLGIGFGQTLNITVPGCNATGAGGAGCNATSTNPALRGFRVGVDGTIPRPVVPAQSIPASPAWGNLSGTVGGALTLFPEILSFQVDPSLKQGKHHSLDFSIQRELKGNMILEVAYVARLARNLQQSVNFLQSPYAQLDRASGQTFAQAFDNVALALRAGGTAANQPWFENNVPGGTAAMVGAGRANFINGNISSLFLTLDQRRMSANLQPFNNYMSQMMLMKTANGLSNYNALLSTLRKRFTKGYRFDATYTLSKSLDQLGQVQNSANVAPNSFDQNVEYGPSAFDITHIFNGLALYELPFKSRLPVLKQILGGWTVSGIFTARSGDPLVVVQGGQVWGGGLFLAASSGAIPTVNPSTLSNSVNRGVAGANNIGTNSNAATGGSGLNMFGNPDTVFNGFRRVEISRDGRAGRSNPLRGMPRWNLDTSIGKTTTLNRGEHPVSLRISFDFFNVFNKVDFNNPNLDLNNSRAFGVITTQLTPGNRIDGSRWIQMGVRIEF